jgi:hypothetical protein
MEEKKSANELISRFNSTNSNDEVKPIATPVNSEQQFIQNQPNPYAEFEPAYDIMPLPSKGLFYPKINDKVIDSVKIYYLTAEDETIMMSPNLLQSGQMLNELLRKKVVCDYPVDKMLVGDRLAILIYLRATMEQMYKVELVDPDTGEKFEHEIDLAQLEIKEVEHQPNQDGFYDFVLPKSQRRVTFRLMTGEDERTIAAIEKQEQKLRKTSANLSRMLRFEHLVVAIEGISDPLAKSHFLRNMPLMDARKLSKYMDDVTPTINLEIEVPTPSGGNFRTLLPITTEFLYPTI